MTGKQEHKDKYKKIKDTAQREIRRAQSNYMQEIISLQLDEKPKSLKKIEKVIVLLMNYLKSELVYYQGQ
jgi:hypothetical protein